MNTDDDSEDSVPKAPKDPHYALVENLDYHEGCLPSTIELRPRACLTSETGIESEPNLPTIADDAGK